MRDALVVALRYMQWKPKDFYELTTVNNQTLVNFRTRGEGATLCTHFIKTKIHTFCIPSV